MSLPLPCPDSVLLKAVLSGRVSPEEHSQIALHLEECEQCRMAVDLITDLSDSDDITQHETSESQFAADSVLCEYDSFEVHDPGPDVSSEIAPQQQPTPAPSLDDFVRDLCTPSDFPDSLGRLGQYEILQRIGRGGMGVVYRGHDLKLGRDVAIKLLKPRVAADHSFVERFTREARAAAAIVHHNVITVHAIDEADGIPYIVMEFVPGESLQKRIRRLGPLPLHLVASIGAQIADGLSAAHARRVTHRDIKPANILLVENTNEVRLGDFGLARAEGSDRLTKTGVVLGTPRYMSPEQARGDTVDHRSDLFSLGSVLYTMCVGRAPISGSRQAEVLSAVANARINPIEAIDPSLPDWLTAVVRKLHALNPNDRFQSAEHVASILRRPLGEFDQSELATDDGWHDGTVIPTGATAPAFERRQAEETVVESRMTRLGDLSQHTGDAHTSVSETGLPGASLVGTTVTPGRSRRRTVTAVSILVALCAIVPAAFHFLWEPEVNRPTPATPAANDFIPQDDLIAQDDLGPLPPMEALIPELQFHVPAKKRWFETLQAAIDAAPPGGTIEIAANGRVRTSTLNVNGSVIIRPARGQQPVLALDATERPEDDRNYPLFRVSRGTLVLEGMDLEVIPQGVALGPSMRTRFSAVRIEDESGRLLMAHCRVRMPPGDPMQIAVQAEASPLVDIRHCEFFCGTGIGWTAPADGRLHIESSVIVARTGVTLRHSAASNATIELSRSTFANEELFKLLVPSAAFRAIRQNTAPRGQFSITVHASESMIDCREAMLLLRPLPTKFQQNPAPTLSPRDLATLPIYRLLAWRGHKNIYDPGNSYVAMAMNSTVQARSVDTLESWQDLWRGQDQTSRQGLIRFGEYESFVPAMSDLPSVDRLRIIRFEDGEPILPFAPPGAIINQIGPTDYSTWRDSPAAENIRAAALAE